MRRALIWFLRWLARRHWGIKLIALLILIIPIGGPVAVWPRAARWWDGVVDEAYKE